MEGTGKGTGHHSAGGGGVVARFEDDGRDVGRGDNDGTAGFRDATTTAVEEGNSSRDGGGGVVARYEDNGRDVGQGDDDATAQDAEDSTVAAGERGGGSDGGGGEAARLGDSGDAAEEGGSDSDGGEVTPPPLPPPVLRYPSVQVRARVPMNPFPIDLPET